jgi:5'-deoxynucleotidase YfbR-like HD superfamily hydrolase
MSLAQLYLSGEARRWHANPALAGSGQTVADHQCRAAQLLLALHRDASPSLIYAVLHHDVGEAWAGDLPQPFKARCPELARAHAAIEADMVTSITGKDLPYLTPEEGEWLVLVDRLEALLFVLFRNPAEYGRASSDWARGHAVVLALAERLGCLDAVDRVIEDMTGGVW